MCQVLSAVTELVFGSLRGIDWILTVLLSQYWVLYLNINY